MHIEIKDFELDLDDEFTRHEKKIVIDGIVDEQSSIHGRRLYIRSNDTAEKIKKLTGQYLKDFFESVYFEHAETWCEWTFGIQIILEKSDEEFVEEERPIPNINVDLRIDLRNWNKAYTVNDLEKVYEKLSSNDKEIIFYKDEVYAPDDIFGIYALTNLADSIENTLSTIMVRLKLLHEKVLDYLDQNVNSDVITTLFQFPEEIKASCKQYLIYFGQFLADLGLHANTAIKEEANKVLFTVIPEQGDQAIEKIREALEIFLNAPGNDLFENSNSDFVSSNDIAILQWKSNIFHLKSQLALSSALIQAKDATIEALQLSNYRLQESNQQLLAQSKSEEKVLGGVVSITKYEGKGFTVDIAEIFRRLKRKFM